MKHLRSVFNNSLTLLLLLMIAIITVFILSRQNLISSEQAVKAQTVVATQETGIVVAQSPLAPPTATPMPNAKDLKVANIELEKNGPYQNIVWSPDGQKALISKQYTQYLLERDKNASKEGLSTSTALGVTTGLGDLWLLDLKTGTERQLLKQTGRYTWSPDSTKVAYLAPIETEGIGGVLNILDIASGQITQAARVDFLGSEYTPYWLPTNEIVYVRDGQLWAVQPDAKSERSFPNLRFFSRLGVEMGKAGYLDNPDAVVGFHFSPDGKRVVYKTRSKNERALAYRLWLANVDGSNAELLTEQAEGSYYEWSPNGEWLLFNTYRDIDDPNLDIHLPSTQALWVVRANGTEAHSLYKVDNWRWIVSPNWSPDSSMVVFSEYLIVPKSDSPKGVFLEGSLQIADAKSGVSTPLAGLSDKGEAPARVWWTPDGKYLLTFHDGGTPETYQNYRLTLGTK